MNFIVPNIVTKKTELIKNHNTVSNCLRFKGFIDDITKGNAKSGNLILKSLKAYWKSDVYINANKCIRYIDTITTATLLCRKSVKRVFILYHIPLKEKAIRDNILVTKGFSKYILLMERISRPSNIHKTKR